MKVVDLHALNLREYLQKILTPTMLQFYAWMLSFIVSQNVG